MRFASEVCFVCLHDTWVGWVFFGTTWGIAFLGAMCSRALLLMCAASTAWPSLAECKVWFQSFCPLEFPMWASMTMYVQGSDAQSLLFP